MSGTTGGTVEITAKKKLRHMKVKAACRVRMQPVQYDRCIWPTIMQTANTQFIETRSSHSIVLFECEAGFRSSSSSRHSAYSFTNAEANAYTDILVKYGSISHSISYHAETKGCIYDKWNLSRKPDNGQVSNQHFNFDVYTLIVHPTYPILHQKRQ